MRLFSLTCQSQWFDSRPPQASADPFPGTWHWRSHLTSWFHSGRWEEHLANEIIGRTAHTHVKLRQVLGPLPGMGNTYRGMLLFATSMTYKPFNFFLNFFSRCLLNSKPSHFIYEFLTYGSFFSCHTYCPASGMWRFSCSLKMFATQLSSPIQSVTTLTVPYSPTG